ncbi:prenyltransferase/squalene oxidase repeat-containing protein [Chitinophaga sp. HK235]|uniref:prenyltransferase/squalene oxidase repeat-containing protein n=1 Tax=Chitinophaga sp. HK235 TaxID=2952571 RepID=UPI001BAC4B75|nr:prenyltransferase/squalene oxidase repeat-containing protein [Chitinophaga sp. HK235]
MRTQVPNEYSLLKATGIFWDTISQSLLSPSRLELLKRSADFFPPIIRFALECRLSNHEQVDLQFCIRRDEDDLSAVYNWFRNKLAGNPENEKILHFLRTWADKSSSCHKNISEVFLELDVLPSGVETPLLFFELQPGLNDTQRKDFCFSILKETLGEIPSYFSLFETILRACPEPAFVAYLGILFSRDAEVLRVNIKKLPVTAVTPFLREIGYAWTGPDLDRWISFVYNYADRVTLCIDIGKDVFPKIGFECFWNEQPLSETYWRFFIEELNTRNDYNKDKIDAILDWDKEIFPGQIKDWPEHLWIASLSKPRNEFTFLKKWISHLKLSYCPDKDIELKAYLGYESKWKVKKPLAFNSDNKEQPVLTTTPDIKQAISKGVDYLLSSQLQSGWWKDFHLSPGSSDEWVTAYVACHLARLKCPKTNEAIGRAWKILKTRYRENEGWGYNVWTPADADSTIWTWLFANTAGFSDEFPKPGVDMMDTYIAENGGIITYSLNGPLGRNSRKTDDQCFNGWQIPHNCVTAAYALAGRQHAIDYLLGQQNTAGYWYSYWWDGPEYATALSVEALFNKDAGKYKKAIDISIKWALDKARKELEYLVPNEFKIALLLRIILCSPLSKEDHHLVKAMVNSLLHAQQVHGCWNPSAELRSPDSDDTEHESRENALVVKDGKMNFATITILDALNKYNQFNVSRSEI